MRAAVSRAKSFRGTSFESSWASSQAEASCCLANLLVCIRIRFRPDQLDLAEKDVGSDRPDAAERRGQLETAPVVAEAERELVGSRR